VFEKIEFSHGDLHLDNIMINISPEPIHLYYRISGQMYKISTLYIVKIFDFDHATIFKSTPIRVNSNYININRVENVQNSTGITNRFNKNIDKVKLFLHLSSNLMVKDILSEFIREIFPGLTSQEKIFTTYSRLLEIEENVTEANRIFGAILQEGVTPEFIIRYYSLENSYLCTMKWDRYFGFITNDRNYIQKYGGLVDRKDDHLWIPDEIILSYESMISTSFFTEFQNAEPINVRQHPIYTIDGRL
jgi:hypothetical protein